MEGEIASLDIALFSLVCLLLFIYVVSYWFQLKYREVKSKLELFCPNMKCDVGLINNRLRALATTIDFLGRRLNEINTVLPFNTFAKGIEGYEGFYSNLAMLEKRCDRIQMKQDRIYKYILSKNPKYKSAMIPKKDVECFQIKTTEDCDKPEILNKLKIFRSKIEEIEYGTNLYIPLLDKINKADAEYNKARDKAINQSSALANQQMSSLIGQPTNIDLNNHLKNGIDPSLEAAIKNGDNRAIQLNILNDPDAQKIASNVKPADFTQNAEGIYKKEGANAGNGYKSIGNNLLSARLNQSDRPNVQSEFNDQLKEQKAPSYITV